MAFVRDRWKRIRGKRSNVIVATKFSPNNTTTISTRGTTLKCLDTDHIDISDSLA